MSDATIRIMDGRGRYRTYPHRWYLWGHGFKYDKKKNAWNKTADYDRIKKYIRFAEKNRLRYEFVSNRTQRNKGYKRNWLDENPSWHGLYLCTYCGWPVTEKRITVDHIVPVQYAKTSLKFERSGKDINSLDNLCGACARCNRIKSDKAGLWVVQGKIFRHRMLRIIRFLLRLILAGIAGYLIYRYLLSPQGEETLRFVSMYLDVIYRWIHGILDVIN